MNEKPMKTAVVGCGAISDIYLTNMINRFDILEVADCCARNPEHAARKAQQYGIKASTYEEILADESIELIVNLTPAPAHYEIIKKALEAGKHVYTEKSMTVSLEEAAELVRLSEEKGLYLGSAPDTFLGSSFQTARKAIDDGLIGEITSCTVAANRDLNFLCSISSFLLMPGGGICYDYGVYYLTALVSILGSVRRACGIVRNPYPLRTKCNPSSPDFGKEMIHKNESQVSAVLDFADGFTGTFQLNGDSIIFDQAGITIYGTRGILRLPDPNQFGGEVLYLPASFDFANPPKPQSLPDIFGFSDNSRGIGPAEMAHAIRAGRPCRAGKEMAYHVLEIITAIMKSSETGSFCEIHSSCERPRPLKPEALNGVFSLD